MRFLVVGAGALGGYFGGRLLEAGRDVTFLLRERRAAQLMQTGLQIRSAFGDLHLPEPPHVLSEQIDSPFDVVVVACKAYDLEATMGSFALAVGPDTAILPLLNGMQHLDKLSERFGADKVLGGLCMISATLDVHGTVLHLNDLHDLHYGELDGSMSPRVQAINEAFSGANFASRASEIILQEMWEKWVFIATAAGITSLMRGSVGDIVAAGAGSLTIALLEECAAIATLSGFEPRAKALERARTVLTTAGSPMTASMAKDIERGAQVESDQLIDDMIRRAPERHEGLSLLRVVQAHLGAYQARRAREQAGAK